MLRHIVVNMRAFTTGRKLYRVMRHIVVNLGAFATWRKLYRVLRHIVVTWEPLLQGLSCTWFWWGNVKGGDQLEDPGIDGRVILSGFSRTRTRGNELDCSG